MQPRSSPGAHGRTTSCRAVGLSSKLLTRHALQHFGTKTSSQQLLSCGTAHSRGSLVDRVLHEVLLKGLRA